MRHLIYLLVALVMMACGGGGGENGALHERDSASSQLVEIENAVKPRKYNADNFFAISSPVNGIFVGNNVEMMSRLDIDSFSVVTMAPDGNTLAYADSDTSERHLHIYKIDSGDDSELDLGPFDTCPADFDASGNILALAVRNLYDVSEIYLVDIKNRTKTMVSEKGNVDGDYNPTFSPDGAYLVFHNMRKVKIYSISNGSPKLWQSIDCENFCQRNDLVLTPDCKFQMTSDHKHIVFSCLDYSTEVNDSYRLIMYDMSTMEIHDLISDESSCRDFQVSDLGAVYYIQVSADSTKQLYMADLENISTVRVSDKPLCDSVSLSIAY